MTIPFYKEIMGVDRPDRTYINYQPLRSEYLRFPTFWFLVISNSETPRQGTEVVDTSDMSSTDGPFCFAKWAVLQLTSIDIPWNTGWLIGILLLAYETHPIWVFPKIGGKPPKWMVKIMENPMNKWDDLGGFPPIFGNIHISG